MRLASCDPSTGPSLGNQDLFPRLARVEVRLNDCLRASQSEATRCDDLLRPHVEEPEHVAEPYQFGRVHGRDRIDFTVNATVLAARSVSPAAGRGHDDLLTEAKHFDEDLCVPGIAVLRTASEARTQ